MRLGAFPAVRLLFSDGERFEVDARDLDLDLDEEAEVFDRLDGFSIVDVSIEDSVAGPFELEASASLATARVPTASSPTARRPPAGSPRRASRPWSCPENRSPT